MIKYFKNVETVEDLRKEYKRLVFQLHPDKGGNEEAFKEMINEYEKLFKILPKTKTNKKEKTEKTINDLKMDKELRETLESILQFKDIEVEVIGSYLWVYGNTYPIKEQLKALKFFWSKGHKCWMWNGQEKKYYKKSTNKNAIVDKYGSTSYKGKGIPYLED